MGVNINPGNYRHKIIVQSKTFKSDASTEGVPTEVWTDFFSCYASFEPGTGKESYKVETSNAEYNATFTMRYHSNLDSAMRILYLGQVFNIIGPPIDTEGRHKEHQVHCMQAISNA